LLLEDVNTRDRKALRELLDRGITRPTAEIQHTRDRLQPSDQLGANPNARISFDPWDPRKMPVGHPAEARLHAGRAKVGHPD
jgi:hypothetical protein